MPFYKAADTISGQEGTAYATINGQVEQFLELKTFEANVSKKKSDIKTLGKRTTQYKATGAECKGSMEYYAGRMSTIVAHAMRDYVKDGRDLYFDMTIVNNDPTSSVGVRTVVLFNVNFDNANITTLNVDSDALTEKLDFTFDGFELLDEFGAPVEYGE